MAKKSMIAKASRKPKFEVRGYHRCYVCGRARAYMRRFALCRSASGAGAYGAAPVTKSSW